MTKLTQGQFDAIEVVNGVKHIPAGTDCTAIVHFDARCIFGDGCIFDAGCIFIDGCRFGAGCRFDARCIFGDGCKAISPYWSYAYPPPFKTAGPIRPTEACREYWSERLGVPLEGCYDAIATAHRDKIDGWLALDKWTPCERRILESWK